jgi:hypothetical protein
MWIAFFAEQAELPRQVSKQAKQTRLLNFSPALNSFLVCFSHWHSWQKQEITQDPILRLLNLQLCTTPAL